MAVNTSKVAGRRQLHFERLEDILRDVESLNGCKCKALGNWSGGQILTHLATVMNGSIDGALMRPPLIYRMLGRLMKGYVLKKGMPPGYQLKGKAAESLIPGETGWEDGLTKFRQALHRQETESKREPSPFLGPMTRDDWNRLHCRHAELHLSFLVPMKEQATRET